MIKEEAVGMDPGLTGGFVIGLSVLTRAGSIFSNLPEFTYTFSYFGHLDYFQFFTGTKTVAKNMPIHASLGF